MSRKLTTAGLYIACLLTACAVGLAQLGGVVSDPGAYTRMATELKQLVSEYNELVNLYQMSTNTYDNLRNASQFITTKSAWMPAASSWQTPGAANTYGNTSGWMSAATTGTGARAAYSAATVPLQPYGAVWGAYDPSVQSVLASRYGLVQISDGMAANALAQSGAVRGSSAANRAALAQLVADASSNNPATNTQVGVLNQISAAGVIQANQQTQAAQLAAASLDLQTAEAAARRQRTVAEINDGIAFRSSYTGAATKDTAGASAALQAFRP